MRVRIMTNARPLGERRSGGTVDAPSSPQKNG